MDLVGEILAREPLVSRLVAAQALDVLEVEGGGLVFDKLVSLCGGSRQVSVRCKSPNVVAPFLMSLSSPSSSSQSTTWLSHLVFNASVQPKSESVGGCPATNAAVKIRNPSSSSGVELKRP